MVFITELMYAHCTENEIDILSFTKARKKNAVQSAATKTRSMIINNYNNF